MSDSPLPTPSTTSENVGQYQGLRFYGIAEEIKTDHPFVADSNTTTTVKHHTPYLDDAISRISAWHAYTEFDSLTLKVTSGPGSYGRRIALHWAWAAEKWGSVHTLHDMAAWPTYGCATFGGAHDPAPFSVVVPCPFSPVLSRRVDSDPTVGSRVRLWMAVSHHNIGADQFDGAWFYLRLEGTVKCWGGILA